MGIIMKYQVTLAEYTIHTQYAGLRHILSEYRYLFQTVL